MNQRFTIALSTLVMSFVLFFGVIVAVQPARAQTTSPTTTPRPSPTMVVPSGAPSTGHAPISR